MTVNYQEYIKSDDPTKATVPICQRSKLAEEVWWQEVFKARRMKDPLTIPPPHARIGQARMVAA